MLKYAREDTQYLLHIYDCLQHDLYTKVKSTRLIKEVEKKSQLLSELKMKDARDESNTLMRQILCLGIFKQPSYKPGPIPETFESFRDYSRIWLHYMRREIAEGLIKQTLMSAEDG